MKKTFLNRIGIATTRQLHEAEKTGERSFIASQITRLNQDLSATETQIDQDIKSGGRALRARSRMLAINNGTVRRYIQLYLANVIGANGHTFQSNITELVENPKTNSVKRQPDKIANMRIARHWAEFQKPLNCSIDKAKSYAHICKLLGMYRIRDGEAFLLRIIDANAPYGFRLQIIPPELIDEEYDIELQNGNQVIRGVELNQFREEVAFYFRRQTPMQSSYWSQYSGTRIRIPAENMIHWYDPEYANQTRGFTRFVSAMLLLHDIDQYVKACVKNARFTAAKGGFFGESEDDDPNAYIGDNSQAGTNGGKDLTIDGDSLVFTSIGKQRFFPLDPKFPTQQHEMFMRSTMRDVASALGCGYSSLSNDFVGATWSSLRQELYVERRNWLNDQQSLIDNVHMRVFEWFLDGGLMNGAIGLPYSKKQKFYQPVFIGPRWPYINPVDETTAKNKAIRTLQQSVLDSVAETGESFEQICADYKEAKEIAAGYDLDLDEMLSEEPKKETAPAKQSDPEENLAPVKNQNQMQEEE